MQDPKGERTWRVDDRERRLPVSGRIGLWSDREDMAEMLGSAEGEDYTEVEIGSRHYHFEK